MFVYITNYDDDAIHNLKFGKCKILDLKFSNVSIGNWTYIYHNIFNHTIL